MSATTVFLSLFLAGCVSTNPTAWTHAPDEQTRAKRDIYECRAQADDASYRATAFGGVILPVMGLFQRRSVFNECMESKGWRTD